MSDPDADGMISMSDESSQTDGGWLFDSWLSLCVTLTPLLLFVLWVCWIPLARRVLISPLVPWLILLGPVQRRLGIPAALVELWTSHPSDARDIAAAWLSLSEPGEFAWRWWTRYNKVKSSPTQLPLHTILIPKDARHDLFEFARALPEPTLKRLLRALLSSSALSPSLLAVLQYGVKEKCATSILAAAKSALSAWARVAKGKNPE